MNKVWKILFSVAIFVIAVCVLLDLPTIKVVCNKWGCNDTTRVISDTTIQNILDSAIKNKTKPDTDIFDKDCIVYIVIDTVKVDKKNCDNYIDAISGLSRILHRVKVVFPEKIKTSDGKVREFYVEEDYYKKN